MFHSMIEEELKIALAEAADYFDSRSISEWASEARETVKQVEQGDFSFVECLWVKYAPTCDIDDLLITEYSPDQEEKVNELNSQLAKVANKLFALFERAKSEKT